MQPDTSSDTLKSKVYFFPDTQPLQESVDKIVAELNTEKAAFVSKFFTDNTIWIGKKVTVPTKDGNLKEIAVQYKPLTSVYQLEVEFFVTEEP